MTSKNDRRRGSRYERLKRRVREEEDYKCRDCGAWAKEVDHIVPLSKGGVLMERSNLQVLCGECHRRKTEKENVRIPGRLAWNQAIRKRYG